MDVVIASKLKGDWAMFKKASRCMLSAMLLVGISAFTYSGILQAQEHGGYTLKSCGPPVRTCDSNADCSDANECTEDSCDTTIDDTYNCTFSFNHGDEFGDWLVASDAYDTIILDGDGTCANAGDCLTVDASELTIYGIEGNAICDGVNAGSLPAAANTVLPCTVKPASTVPILAPGRVRFRSNTYEPTMADLANSPLRDRATVVYKEICDSPTSIPDDSCNPTDDALAQAISQQNLVDGCEYNPITCDDQNLCTDDSCNPATGCVYTPNYDCDDQDACTNDSCDPATGHCVNTPNYDCEDQDACTCVCCAADAADGVRGG